MLNAKAALVANGLHDLPPGAQLVPGMTCSVEIKVGQRRIITYLIDPLVRALDESLREP